MIQTMRNIGALIFALAALVLLITPATSRAASNDIPDAPDSVAAPKWQRTVPSSTCSSGGYNCHRASPALADVDNDGRDDIIVATNAGHIVAIKDDGTADGRVLFDVDVANHIGMAPNTAIISSSPAVADVDVDGRVEIVVGFGFELGTHTKGGLIVLEHTGQVKSGWPRMSIGLHGNGNPKSIVSSPALGDLDQDGDLEIVVGGLDKRVYAYHHNGSLLPGFTATSALAVRFPDWGFEGVLADAIWSSPALGDVDGDGYLDIVIGTAEGNYDARWGGDSGGWVCPYTPPPGWPGGYCGGSVYALDRFGRVLPGFPQYVLEAVQSSPALADVDGDGKMEIFIGTGSFYYFHSPDRPTHGFRHYAFDHNGQPLPGWAGGKVTGGSTQSSPAIGDIAGDSAPEIVFGARDGRIHAYSISGQSISGFPMTPRSRTGSVSDHDVGKTFLLVDYDGDDKMEIVVNVAESVVIVNGNGQQITSTSNGSDGRIAFGTTGWLFNSPAVGNIDGDADLELVAFDRNLFVWDLSGTGGHAVVWGQFKRDAAGLSSGPMPARLAESPAAVGLMCPASGGCAPTGRITLVNGGDEPLSWSVATGDTSWRVSFGASSGTIPPRSAGDVTFTVNTSGLGNGQHDLGSVTIAATNSAGGSAGGANVPLWLYKGTIHSTFAPTVRGGD